ncbi:MAG: hypothetical protein J6S97_10440 [Bacteroidales bacterium]|nr:hypothetical protein [Bacteroidales bacterium]
MGRSKLLLYTLLPLLLLSACNGNDQLEPVQKVNSYKVAVVLPASEKEDLSRIVDWAQDNIKAAQLGGESRIELSLEWIDEEDATMAREVARVTHDNSYVAIIGPRYSRNARTIAKESLSYRIPVLAPSVTSTEFQRIYAGSNMTDPNIFCLAENDMAQCQAMLSKARANNYSRISLISRDGKKDDYAASFQQFYAYMAREMDMLVEETYFYENKGELEAAIQKAIAAEQAAPFPGVLFFVPSSAQDMLDFDEAIGRSENRGYLSIVCTDMAYDLSLEGKLKSYNYEGTALASRPGEGFDIAWQTRYGTVLPGGYAQLFDCFYLLAIAAAVVDSGDAASVREALWELTSGEKVSTPIYPWTVSGMRNAFQAARNGDYRYITGVSGSLLFESQTHICQLGTTYSTWTYTGGKYVETGRFARSYTGSDLWNWTTTQIEDSYDEFAVELPYPALQDHFAVVIATSTGRINYRHQADALAQYQMLKGFGYDDDHIILILEDDLGDDVHVTIDGENLRPGAIVDYHTSQVTAEDLRNIFSGTVTERTPVVVRGGPGTNVFLFWSGHGARDRVLKWADKDLDAETFRGLLEAAGGHYRKLLAVMETCYSGSIGTYCEGLPGVLLLCATRNGETSHADVLEDGIYLSNRFTRVFRSEVEANPSISLHQLFYQLATHTTASHAGLYNDDCYGNVYRNTLEEFLIPRVPGS